MLEAWVDLRNLVRDRSYGYLLEAIALEQKIRFMTDVQADASEATQVVRAARDFSTKLANHKRQLAQVNRKIEGYGRSIYSRFERAGLKVEYQTVYAGPLLSG